MIDTLPLELINHIFQWLHVFDQFKLSLTCRTLRFMFTCEERSIFKFAEMLSKSNNKRHQIVLIDFVFTYQSQYQLQTFVKEKCNNISAVSSLLNDLTHHEKYSKLRDFVTTIFTDIEDDKIRTFEETINDMISACKNDNFHVFKTIMSRNAYLKYPSMYIILKKCEAICKESNNTNDNQKNILSELWKIITDFPKHGTIHYGIIGAQKIHEYEYTTAELLANSVLMAHECNDKKTWEYHTVLLREHTSMRNTD